jgi:hypothetical protein
MKKNIFTQNSPGHCEIDEHPSLLSTNVISRKNFDPLRSLNLEFTYYMPNNLPPKILYSNEMFLLLSKADRFIGELNGISNFVKNSDLLVYPYLSREATSSTQLEGTLSTLEDYWIYETKEESHKEITDVIDIHNYIEAPSSIEKCK